jgi:hypothetical protein
VSRAGLTNFGLGAGKLVSRFCWNGIKAVNIITEPVFCCAFVFLFKFDKQHQNELLAFLHFASANFFINLRIIIDEL